MHLRRSSAGRNLCFKELVICDRVSRTKTMGAWVEGGLFTWATSDVSRSISSAQVTRRGHTEHMRRLVTHQGTTSPPPKSPSFSMTFAVAYE